MTKSTAEINSSSHFIKTGLFNTSSSSSSRSSSSIKSSNSFCCGSKSTNYPNFSASIQTNSRLYHGNHSIHNATCDCCSQVIVGVRHRCLSCEDYDVCQDCLSSAASIVHSQGHTFLTYRSAEDVVNSQWKNISKLMKLGKKELSVKVIKKIKKKKWLKSKKKFDSASSSNPQNGEIKSTENDRKNDPNNNNNNNHMADINHSLNVHSSALCDQCQSVIIGVRWKCLNCENFDFCGNCESRSDQLHDPLHVFAKIKRPVLREPPLDQAVFYNLYQNNDEKKPVNKVNVEVFASPINDAMDIEEEEEEDDDSMNTTSDESAVIEVVNDDTDDDTTDHTTDDDDDLVEDKATFYEPLNSLLKSSAETQLNKLISNAKVVDDDDVAEPNRIKDGENVSSGMQHFIMNLSHPSNQSSFSDVVCNDGNAAAFIAEERRDINLEKIASDGAAEIKNKRVKINQQDTEPTVVSDNGDLLRSKSTSIIIDIQVAKSNAKVNANSSNNSQILDFTSGTKTTTDVKNNNEEDSGKSNDCRGGVEILYDDDDDEANNVSPNNDNNNDTDNISSLDLNGPSNVSTSNVSSNQLNDTIAAVSALNLLLPEGSGGIQENHNSISSNNNNNNNNQEIKDSYNNDNDTSNSNNSMDTPKEKENDGESKEESKEEDSSDDGMEDWSDVSEILEGIPEE